MVKLAEKHSISAEALPKVCLPKDIQGLQADYAIFDAAISHAATEANLSILADPFIINIIFTRGSKATILVATDELRKGKVARGNNKVVPKAYNRSQPWIIANIL